MSVPAEVVTTPRGIDTSHRALGRRRVDVRALAHRARAGLWRMRLPIALATAYFALGAWLVLHVDLVVLDALSRSAHASFVFHNGPPKLVAIGLVWPPVTTMLLLPFASITPLAMTGLAAPLVSAILMTSLVVVIARELARLETPRRTRHALVALLAIHPMLVYYGANGMSDVLGLLLPTLAVVAAIRWYETRSSTAIATCSFACALAAMSRYELAAIAAVLVAGIVGIVLVEERDRAKARAIAIFFVLPTAYALAVWMFLNWSIIGSPIWFLTGGGQIATVAGIRELHTSIGAGLAGIVLVQALLFPLTGMVIAALVAWGVRARRWFAVVLAAAAAYNPLTNLALVALSSNIGLAQLRYNMRGIPIALLAAAWLMRDRRRAGAGTRWMAGATVAFMAAALPGTIALMWSYPQQFSEAAFIRALISGDRLTGITTHGQTVGCQGARDMGRYVRTHITRRNAVIADDSSSYAVMLFSGHPERFVDRIDKGDAYFIDQLARPAAGIDYLLTTDFKFCAGVREDTISRQLGANVHRSGAPGLTLVHATRSFRLYRIDHGRFGR